MKTRTSQREFGPRPCKLLMWALSCILLAAICPVVAQSAEEKPTASRTEVPFGILKEKVPFRSFGDTFTARCKQGHQFLVVGVKQVKKEERVPASELDYELVDGAGTKLKPIGFGVPSKASPEPFTMIGGVFTGQMEFFTSEDTTFALFFLVPKAQGKYSLSKSGSSPKLLRILKSYDPPEGARALGSESHGSMEFRFPSIDTDGWGEEE